MIRGKQNLGVFVEGCFLAADFAKWVRIFFVMVYYALYNMLRMLVSPIASHSVSISRTKAVTFTFNCG